jgi:hypothetical protein
MTASRRSSSESSLSSAVPPARPSASSVAAWQRHAPGRVGGYSALGRDQRQRDRAAAGDHAGRGRLDQGAAGGAQLQADRDRQAGRAGEDGEAHRLGGLTPIDAPDRGVADEVLRFRRVGHVLVAPPPQMLMGEVEPERVGADMGGDEPLFGAHRPVDRQR